jgi:H+/Cl- antiporter ClcA
MDLLGGLMTWAADRLRAMRARFGFAQPDGGSRRQRLARQWSNLVALAVVLFVFGALARSLYSGGFLTLSEGFVWSDLLWSVPLGALGALAGGLFLRLLALGQTLLAPLKSRPVLRSVLGGGVLGLLATLVPMLLFSGQHDMQAVSRQAAALGSWMLLLIALARMALIALLLNSGWKGGQFLPLMFASAALGLSVGQALPFLSTPVSILAVMAGLLAVVLPNPLISLALMALMFPLSYVGISAAAVLTVLAGKALFKRRANRRAAQSPLQPNQSAQP